MNISLAAQAPFGDEAAFDEFLGVHNIAHQTLAERAAQGGVLIVAVPFADTPIGNPDWLLDHYQVHAQLARVTNTVLPDISTVDFTDEGQYHDWMDTHAQVHDQLNQILGIF